MVLMHSQTLHKRPKLVSVFAPFTHAPEKKRLILIILKCESRVVYRGVIYTQKKEFWHTKFNRVMNRLKTNR